MIHSPEQAGGSSTRRTTGHLGSRVRRGMPLPV